MTQDRLFTVAPLHLRSKSEIADTFGVSRETVLKWAREGAPVFLVAKRYQADYHAMVEWLSKNKKIKDF